MRAYQAALCLICLTGTMADARTPESTFATLEKRWESARKELNLPGVAIAVVRNGAIIYEKGFGLANIEQKRPFTPQTSAYIASVTKVFTTFAVMQLVDAGKVNLDAPVKSYLPRFQLADAALTERITVRDLLCHRQGLSNWPITFAEAYSGVFDDDFYYRELAHTEAKGKWAYDNLHFTLLGRIVEAVSGELWQTYFQEHIFGPAGMRGSTARASELFALPDCAVPYVEENNAWIPCPLRKVDSTMHAAGGVGASAHDLARWLLIHLNLGAIDGTRLLSEDAVSAILTANAEPNDRYSLFGRKQMGLGWYLGDYKGELLVHHFGGYAGAHAHVSFMPQQNIGVAVITNSGESSAALVHYMAADSYDALLGRKPGRELHAFVKKTLREQKHNAIAQHDDAASSAVAFPRPLDAYDGTFTSETWGPLKLNVDGAALSGAIGNFQMKFSCVGNGDVRVESPLGTGKAIFHERQDGAVDGLQVSTGKNWTMEFKR